MQLRLNCQKAISVHHHHVREADVYHGVLFNEFGITALEFTYQPQTKKVELIEVIAMLDKWYIRRVLKNDLQHVMENLMKG